MIIRISGLAEVTMDDGGAVPATVHQELDGRESDAVCSDYLDMDLAELGITGGTVRLTYDANAGAFRVTTEYTSPVELGPAELERLVRDTRGQWSDGIGEGCFDELAYRLGVMIDLSPYGRDEGLRVEQVDDGRVVGPARTGVAKAARQGDLAALRAQLEAGADCEARLQGYTPLHLAVLYGQAEAALELIARGADVNARDPQGQDALTLAAVSNSMADAGAARVARALLGRGADVHGPHGPQARPKHGEYTPLYMAKNRKKAELAAVLREFGAAR